MFKRIMYQMKFIPNIIQMILAIVIKMVCNIETIDPIMLKIFDTEIQIE